MGHRPLLDFKPVFAIGRWRRNASHARALPSMGEKSNYVARIENIYFLSCIGASLRWATNDIAREELPDDIRLLLRRLERLEAKALRQRPESGPPA
jgi:hypothetical protein